MPNPGEIGIITRGIRRTSAWQDSGRRQGTAAISSRAIATAPHLAGGDGDLCDLVGAKSALGGDAKRLLREHDDTGFGRLRPRAPGEATEGGEGVLELAELFGLEDAGAVKRER